MSTTGQTPVPSGFLAQPLCSAAATKWCSTASCAFVFPRGAHAFVAALCLVALTAEDLYDANSDLFVAGMARGNAGVAVFSLHRYDPALRFSDVQCVLGSYHAWIRPHLRATAGMTKGSTPLSSGRLIVASSYCNVRVGCSCTSCFISWVWTTASSSRA